MVPLGGGASFGVSASAAPLNIAVSDRPSHCRTLAARPGLRPLPNAGLSHLSEGDFLIAWHRFNSAHNRPWPGLAIPGEAARRAGAGDTSKLFERVRQYGLTGLLDFRKRLKG